MGVRAGSVGQASPPQLWSLCGEYYPAKVSAVFCGLTRPRRRVALQIIEFVHNRIGVGTADWDRPPLPPNRTCRSPASGSPVGGLTSERIGRRGDGLSSGQKPMLRNVGVHPLFEGRQHAVGPDPQFGPKPFRSARGRSLVVSSYEHSLGFRFWVLVHPTSTFLGPFAPRALPRFPAPMGPLTPVGPLPPGCVACSLLAARDTGR